MGEIIDLREKFEARRVAAQAETLPDIEALQAPPDSSVALSGIGERETPALLTPEIVMALTLRNPRNPRVVPSWDDEPTPPKGA